MWRRVTPLIYLWWICSCNVACNSSSLPPTYSPCCFFSDLSQTFCLKVRLYLRSRKLTHMFSINWLQTAGRSLSYAHKPSIQFPLCSTAPNGSHRLWRIYGAQLVNRKKFFLITRGWTGVQTPPNFNQSPFVVKCRAVLSELFGAQPAWLPRRLPAKLPWVMELSAAWSCTP